MDLVPANWEALQEVRPWRLPAKKDLVHLGALFKITTNCITVLSAAEKAGPHSAR